MAEEKHEMALGHDEQVIQEVAMMFEMGYMDKEFTMHGCVYKKDGQRHYLTSSYLEKIHECMETLPLQGILVTLPDSIQKICSVPAGENERIAQDVKRQLAVKLQAQYDEAFFEKLEALAQTPSSNTAYDLLEAYREEIDGFFDRDELQLFEILLHMAYTGKVLTEKSYAYFNDWLRDIYNQLRDDALVHDIFSKTFYSIACVLPNGTLKYYTNAQRERIQDRKLRLEAENKVVSPIFSKIWGYNYEYDLMAARSDHDKALEGILTQEFMNKVQTIRTLPSAIDTQKYMDLLQQLEEEQKPEQAATLRYYGKLWHVDCQ